MDGEQRSRRRSKAISWAEKMEEPEESEAIASSPSESTPSDQEFTDIAGSVSSVSSPISSGPASLSSSGPDKLPASQETATALLPPLALPRSEPLAVPVASVAEPASLSSSVASAASGLTDPISSSANSSRSSPGLWKKIKGAAGLKRPSSFSRDKRQQE
jgi:hypothetical protein